MVSFGVIVGVVARGHGSPEMVNNNDDDDDENADDDDAAAAILAPMIRWKICRRMAS